ncbi:hypothetical protein M8J75_012494 [Diaphorina citri]|nr:hypothetical protein M8J75_012494 [Diaphorina citri]
MPHLKTRYHEKKTKSKSSPDKTSSITSQQSQGIHINSYGFAENILKQIENLCNEASDAKNNNQSIVTINEQLIDKYIISKIICIGTICKNCKYMFHNNYNIYKHMLECRANNSGVVNDNKSVGIIKILKYNYYCMICKYYYFNNLNEFYLHFNNVHKNMILNNNNDDDKNDKNSDNSPTELRALAKYNENQEEVKIKADETNVSNINEKSKKKEVTDDSGNKTDKLDDKTNAIETEINEIVGKITNIASSSDANEG